jgi:hypothetical protein
VTFDEMEAALRARLEALPSAAAPSSSMFSDSRTSTGQSGSASSGGTETRTVAGLLIDCE